LAIPDILHATTKSPGLRSHRKSSLSPLFVNIPSPSVPSSLVKRRLRPRPLFPKALDDLLDGSDIKLFLSEFVRGNGAEFCAVAAEAVLINLVRKRVGRERRVEHRWVGVL